MPKKLAVRPMNGSVLKQQIKQEVLEESKAKKAKEAHLKAKQAKREVLEESKAKKARKAKETHLKAKQAKRTRSRPLSPCRWPPSPPEEEPARAMKAQLGWLWGALSGPLNPKMGILAKSLKPAKPRRPARRSRSAIAMVIGSGHHLV